MIVNMDEPRSGQDAAEELRAAVGQFVRRVREHDTMPAGQSAVLGHLARDGRLSITALAEREQVRHQSMARTVKLLLGQGLLDSIPDEQDRRRVMLQLTPAGAARMDGLRSDRAGWIARAAADRLTAEERAILFRIPGILSKLVAGAD